MIHRTAIIGGERIEVTWSVAENALEATVNGRTYKLEFRQVGAGAYWFGWNGLSIQALVTPQDQGYFVSIGGSRIPVEFLESAKKSRQTTKLSYASRKKLPREQSGIKCRYRKSNCKKSLSLSTSNGFPSNHKHNSKLSADYLSRMMPTKSQSKSPGLIFRPNCFALLQAACFQPGYPAVLCR